MLKTLACVIGLVALAAMAPACGQAHPKHAQVTRQSRPKRDHRTKTAPWPKANARSGASTGARSSSWHRSDGQPVGPPMPPPPRRRRRSKCRLARSLDKLSASLKQIEASLERHDLTDAELQDSASADRSDFGRGRRCPRSPDAPPRRDQDAPRPAWPETG